MMFTRRAALRRHTPYHAIRAADAPAAITPCLSHMMMMPRCWASDYAAAARWWARCRCHDADKEMMTMLRWAHAFASYEWRYTSDAIICAPRVYYARCHYYARDMRREMRCQRLRHCLLMRHERCDATIIYVTSYADTRRCRWRCDADERNIDWWDARHARDASDEMMKSAMMTWARARCDERQRCAPRWECRRYAIDERRRWHAMMMQTFSIRGVTSALCLLRARWCRWACSMRQRRRCAAKERRACRD